MDNLPKQIDGGIGRRFGKIFFGSVSEVNGALDAVAKTEFLGEFDGNPVGADDTPIGANAFNQFTPIMRKHLGGDRLHDVGPAEVDFMRRAGRVRVL